MNENEIKELQKEEVTLFNTLSKNVSKEDFKRVTRLIEINTILEGLNNR